MVQFLQKHCSVLCHITILHLKLISVCDVRMIHYAIVLASKPQHCEHKAFTEVLIDELFSIVQASLLCSLLYPNLTCVFDKVLLCLISVTRNFQTDNSFYIKTALIQAMAGITKQNAALRKLLCLNQLLRASLFNQFHANKLSKRTIVVE